MQPTPLSGRLVSSQTRSDERGWPRFHRPRGRHGRGGACCDGRRASAHAAAQALIFARSVVGDNSAHMLDDGVDAHVNALAGTAVFHLDEAIVDPTPSNNDGGHPNQFGIFETNPR